MSDEKRFDDETQRFYDENKEMIDRILAQSRETGGSDAAYAEEMVRRAAFERRARMEYEAERARREAFDKADAAYSDFKYGRDRTMQAMEESRDHLRDYSRRQGDYLLNMLFEELDHMRDTAFRGRQYVHDRYASDRDAARESRDHLRQMFNEGFDDVFGPISDTQFQKHMFGAGLELWMAFNALVRSAPFPDSVKDAFNSAENSKNAEFCSKNPACGRRESSEPEASPADDGHLKAIKITKRDE
ncbi:MAG: hypothetical protein MJZ38_05730 [archaeon]|nr:hypothetical protein [archaeon]